MIGAAILKLTERGVVAATDFPLMRALYEVIGKDRQLEIPWSSLFGGEPLTGRQLESPADKPR